MPEFSLPVLGFSDGPPTPSLVVWKDGTVVGILGALDAEWLKDYQGRLEAELEYKRKLEELRNRDVVVLDDYRKEI
jgi:hypothetical protein